MSSGASGAGKTGEARTSSSGSSPAARTGSVRSTSTARGIVVAGAIAASASPATRSTSSAAGAGAGAGGRGLEDLGERLARRLGDVDRAPGDREGDGARERAHPLRREVRGRHPPQRVRGRQREVAPQRGGGGRAAGHRPRAVRDADGGGAPAAPIAVASTRAEPGTVGGSPGRGTGMRPPPPRMLSRAAATIPSTPSRVTSPPGRPSSPRSGCSVPASMPATTPGTVSGAGARCRAIRPPGG